MLVSTVFIIAMFFHIYFRDYQRRKMKEYNDQYDIDHPEELEDYDQFN